MLVLVCLLVAPAAVRAQTQCGVVQSINFPVDPTFFRIAQDFGAASVRHDGLFHTGEDWTGPRGHTLGQQVRAIANGRVTYASPTGWGRDAGVVIVEHKLPDGSTAYSMYGHIAPTPAAPFPTVLTCVHGGDVIGAIADVRPAPHVHLEIRVNGTDIPGPGYTWDDPTNGGWRQPSRFIRDWQTWLLPALQWHTALAAPDGPAAPPVELDDHSLIFLDSGRVGRLTADGRLLWRMSLDRPAVGLVAQGTGALIFFADGSAQPISRDETPGERWTAPFQPDGPPLAAGDLLVFHTIDGGVAALDPAAKALRWTLAAAPEPRQWAFGGGLIALAGRDALWTIAPDGHVLGQAALRAGAALASTPTGPLLAYTHGGLWRIAPDGVWSLALANAPPNTGSGAIAPRGGGGFYVFAPSSEGVNSATLGAYDAAGAAVWQVALPDVGGLTSLDVHEGILLLTGSHGDLIALRAQTGEGCASARVYGDDRSRPWHSLGSDGVLRVAIADQLFALDWRRFLGGCGV